MKNLLIGLGAVTLVGGCNMNKLGANLTAPILQEASKSFAMENDLEFAREAAPGNLVTLVGFLYSTPENVHLLQTCAQGFAEYAFGFLEDDLEQLPDDEKHEAQRKHLAARATDLYDRALGFALRLIATEDKHFDDAFKKDVSSVEAEAKKLDKDSTAGLFYAGMALASGINLNRNDVGRVVDLPKAIAMIKRSYELDSKFHNSQAAMLLGVVYASQGKAVGGNPERSKKMFEEVFTATKGRYLMAKVLYARYYATVMLDRELFEKTLKEVLDAKRDIWPEQRLANELAKRKAARYLKQADDLF
jgi:hypothetical protein